MTLLEAFGISRVEPECIALAGGGGKTTTMFALARSLKASGARVLVTTTTNIFMPHPDQYDRLLLSDEPDIGDLDGVQAGTLFCLAGAPVEGKNKLKSVAPAFLEQVYARGCFDALIVEADGARRLPVKAPAGYEPVIPACATLVLGCIGMDALGTPIDEEHVHRAQLFCEVTGARPGEPVGSEHIVRLAGAAHGLFKGAPDTARRTVLLNKADTDELRRQACLLADRIAAAVPGVSVAVASMEQTSIHEYLAAKQPVCEGQAPAACKERTDGRTKLCRSS